MKKDFNQLTSNVFDLIIVGGGIHGAVLALQAGRAGYRTALLDKGDFGGATSANSLKIIHGGIRYLQHADFKRMRESILSRRQIMAMLPHLVKPLRCLMPTYGHGIKGREIMRLAFAVYDLIAFDRNNGLPTENHLPCGTAISKEEVKFVVPGINEEGLSGGAIWYDAIARDSERLILEYIKEACRYGVQVANYTAVTQVTPENGRVSGVVAHDLVGNSNMTVRGRCVVNAAGPWLERLPGHHLSRAMGQLWATAINIVVKRKLFDNHAVGLEGYTEYTDKDALLKRGKRLFFFVPWQEQYTMIGTTYSGYKGSPDDFSISAKEIVAVLDDINKIYPHPHLTMADVTYFHGGLLPITEVDENKADSVQLDKSSTILDHGILDGREGLFSIKGVKYTTAPDIAEKMMDKLRRSRLIPAKPQGSYISRPPQNHDFGPTIKKLDKEYEVIKQHLESCYGSFWRDVFAKMVGRDDCDINSIWLVNKPLLLAAELLYFIDEEMAVTLSDVVFRRTNLACAECPDKDVLQKLANFMGEQLNWSNEERDRQIKAVLDVFSILHDKEKDELS